MKKILLTSCMLGFVMMPVSAMQGPQVVNVPQIKTTMVLTTEEADELLKKFDADIAKVRKIQENIRQDMEKAIEKQIAILQNLSKEGKILSQGETVKFNENLKTLTDEAKLATSILEENLQKKEKLKTSLDMFKLMKKEEVSEEKLKEIFNKVMESEEVQKKMKDMESKIEELEKKTGGKK